MRRLETVHECPPASQDIQYRRSLGSSPDPSPPSCGWVFNDLSLRAATNWFTLRITNKTLPDPANRQRNRASAQSKKETNTRMAQPCETAETVAFLKTITQ